MNKVSAHYSDDFCHEYIGDFIKKYITPNSIIVCIGTDRCIGDCLGPLVGTLLKKTNFNLPVFGTISDPIHALNIDKKLEQINSNYPNATIIGIDACLGNSECIGEIQARNYSIRPGKGVGKKLPHVGNASIIGIIAATEDTVFNSSSIRLDLIFKMAKTIVRSLNFAYDSLLDDMNKLVNN